MFCLHCTLRGAPDKFFEDEGEISVENGLLSNGEDEVDGTTFKREPFLDAERLILSGEQRIV